MRIKYLLMTFLIISSGLFGNKKIVVDLSKQRAYAMVNNKTVFSGRISSGTIDRSTPNGTFKIMQKNRKHVSNMWPKNKNGTRGGAPMPYMMRLTNTGIAMHLGRVPNYPASHGCVRLTNGFAQKMFKWASVGTKVNIVGSTPTKRVKRKSVKKKRYTKKKKYKKKKRYTKKKKYKKKNRYKKKKRYTKKKRYAKKTKRKKFRKSKRKRYAKTQQKCAKRALKLF